MYKCELEFLHSKDRNSSLWCVDAFIQLVNTFFLFPLWNITRWWGERKYSNIYREARHACASRIWLAGLWMSASVRCANASSCSKLKVQLTDRDNPHSTAYNHKKTFLFFKGGISLGCTHRQRRGTVDTLGSLWGSETWNTESVLTHGLYLKTAAWIKSEITTDWRPSCRQVCLNKHVPADLSCLNRTFQVIYWLQVSSDTHYQ